MTGRWTVSIAVGDTLPLSPNYRLNRWEEARRKRQLRDQMRWLLRAQHVPRCDRVHVQVAWTPRLNRKRDTENLAAVQKVLIDGCRDYPERRSLDCRRIVEAAWVGVVVDDDPAHVTWDPPIIHQPVKQLRERLQLTITDLTETETT